MVDGRSLICSMDEIMETISIRSGLDGSDQPAMWCCPDIATNVAGASVPLLVSLHTWSHGYAQNNGFAAACHERGWAFIAPDFRGPNNRSEACASSLAVQDVLDAVHYARVHACIDTSRIYLAGHSGGGHMSLVMAARAPYLWAGVSAWVPISDLAAWHAQCKLSGEDFWKDLEAVCGGPPGPSTQAEYDARSSLPVLAGAKGLPIDISAGIHDGHSGGTVPISHSLRAFNVLAAAEGLPELMLTDEQIEEMTRTQQVPASLAGRGKTATPSTGETERRKHRILFRRQARATRLTIFDGGHEIDVQTVLDWLALQHKT